MNNPTNQQSLKDVSLVIATFNEEESIKYVLDELRQYELGEIIIVDGNSSDNTKEIDSSKLIFTNLPSNETLNLSGAGKINSIRPGIHNIDLNTLVMSNGTGLISNYTFVGGSHIFRIISGLRTKKGVLRALQSDKGNNRKLLPSKTSHRSMPAVSERVTVSTPDQSVEVNPCVLTNGYCN